MTYAFPQGACEPTRSDVWPDGTGSHPLSAAVNGTIICCLVSALFGRQAERHMGFLLLLISELFFEIIHGACHTYHDAFYGHCFDVQHIAGLLMMVGLNQALNALDSGRGALSIGLPPAVLAIDTALAWAEAPHFPRVFLAFATFVVLVRRAAVLCVDSPSAVWAARCMMLSATMFAGEAGLGCSVWPLSHVVFECVGLGVFVFTNAAIGDKLDSM